MRRNTDPFERMERLFEQMRREMGGWQAGGTGRWADDGSGWHTGWRTPTGEGRMALESGDSDLETRDRTDLETRDRTDLETRDRGRRSPVRMERLDDEFVAIADLPGFEKEEIDIGVEDGVLTIEASHEVEDDEGFRSRQFFERASLPDGVDTEDASATYSNGVLEIHFPVFDDEDDATDIDIE